MKSMRMALLAAVALAAIPAAAYADAQDRPDHGDHGDHGNRGNNGGDRARPAPPQAQHGSGMMIAPRSAPDVGRPTPPQAPQAQPQAPRQDRGNWQGGNRGPGNGGNWQNRGDARPDRAQQAPNAIGDTGQARAQGWRNDRSNAASNDGRPWDNNNRGQHDGYQGRPDDHRFDNDRRFDGNVRPGNDNRGQWTNGRGNDRSWEANRGQSYNGNRNWDRGGRGGGDHRWDSGRWRNDTRYDWRGWRDNHRTLFSRHYYAPRGSHYRSVYAGFFLQPYFYGSSYWLSDPYDYRLPPAQWPLQWVHYYNDALLVDVTSGEVVDVIPNFFY